MRDASFKNATRVPPRAKIHRRLCYETNRTSRGGSRSRRRNRDECETLKSYRGEMRRGLFSVLHSRDTVLRHTSTLTLDAEWIFFRNFVGLVFASLTFTSTLVADYGICRSRTTILSDPRLPMRRLRQ